jgi:hypothetical protein
MAMGTTLKGVARRLCPAHREHDQTIDCLHKEELLDAVSPGRLLSRLVWRGGWRAIL